MRTLAALCDVVLVVGSANSSNSNRLRELAGREGARAFLLDGPEGLELSWFEGARAIGVTAGASAPEDVVQAVVAQLRAWGQRWPRSSPALRKPLPSPYRRS